MHGASESWQHLTTTICLDAIGSELHHHASTQRIDAAAKG